MRLWSHLIEMRRYCLHHISYNVQQGGTGTQVTETTTFELLSNQFIHESKWMYVPNWKKRSWKCSTAVGLTRMRSIKDRVICI